jgi:two-component system phosphate regulon response regulator OmpR
MPTIATVCCGSSRAPTACGVNVPEKAMPSALAHAKTPPDDAPHLLVIDDDRRIRELLSRFLRSEGYRVTTVESAADARARLAGLRFDLLILDVMMPGETGFEFARKLRTSSNVPILMLTARGEADSRIQGLEIGADDYVGKPFEPRELSLRVASILKRARPAFVPPIEFVRFGEFVFSVPRGELKRGEEVVHLTDREREMLTLLAVRPGETVPRLALAGNNSAGVVGERAVDVQINRLRRKIERDPANPLLVQTVRGVGYRLMITS